jgi:hypothetical protein
LLPPSVGWLKRPVETGHPPAPGSFISPTRASGLSDTGFLPAQELVVVEQVGHSPRWTTSASSITNPWSSDAVRQGAAPMAQSTRRRHRRTGTRRGGCPPPAPRSAPRRPVARSSAAARRWWAHAGRRGQPGGTPPRSARTIPMIESGSACGWVCTAESTARRDASPATRYRVAGVRSPTSWARPQSCDFSGTGQDLRVSRAGSGSARPAARPPRPGRPSGRTCPS